MPGEFAMPETPPPTTDDLHNDLREAANAMNSLTATLAPVAEHVPALLEMVAAWNTGKAVTRTVGVMETLISRASKFAIAIAVIVAAWKLDLKSLLGIQH